MWLGIAFAIRLAIALLPVGFWIDVNTFKAWMAGIITNGPHDFYSKMWCDYPPVYMYFLWAWGKIYQFIWDPGLHYTGSSILTTWIKIPPMLADIGGAYGIFVLLKGRVSLRSAYRTAILYAFNPLLIFVSAVWGQMDSVLILTMLGIIWLLLENQFIFACLLSALAILIKPQGLFLLPLLFLTQWYRQKPWKWVAAAAAGIAMAWVIITPMVPNMVWNVSAIWQPFMFLYDKMLSTASTYPHSTVNAFNLWAMTGNWLPDSRLMLGIPHRIWGLGFEVALVVGMGIYLYRNRSNFNFFLGGTILLLGSYLLLTRMHERYILPAIALLAIATGINRNLKWIYWAFSATAFINIVWVFFYYVTMKAPPDWFIPINTLITGPIKYILVFANVWMFGDLLSYLGEKVEKPAPTADWTWFKNLPVPKWSYGETLGKKDLWGALGIPVAFFFATLWRLGLPNEKIFDEVYHARTAMEYIQGINPYEWTHPPLAKLIIAVGCLGLGDNGWGWRIMGVIFGAVALGLFYLLAHKTFESRRIATIATGLLAIDGVFFVQARTAMTNTYVVFFIIVAALGLISYLKKNHEPSLLLMGIGLGGALATRWSAMYAWGIMLLVLGAYWLMVLRPQWSIGKSAFWMLRCLCYFGLVPVVIYGASYIPYMLQGHNLMDVVTMQKSMWGYHANMHATHSYASPWYQWPFMIRPTWYYFHDWKNGTLSGIDCIGNPAIWWMGLPAVGLFIAWLTKKFDRGAAFVVALALGLYVMWGVQPRSLIFMHYMLEAIPFMILAIAFILNWLWDQKLGKKFAIGYLVVAAGLFLFFYPLLSGLPIPWSFYRMHIWLPTWI